MRKLTKILVFIAMLCFAVTITATAANECNHNWKEIDCKGKECETQLITYQCLKCYSYKSENAAPTQSHKWIEAYKEDATCTKDGCVNYVCSECFKLKSDITKATGHDYTFVYNNDATCTKDGTKIGTCKKCGAMEIFTNVGSAKGHKYEGEWIVVRGSTCLKEGVSKRDCAICGVAEIRYDELGSHADKNKDYKCDVCKLDMSPESDSNSDNDPIIINCSCKCHKGGISGFFWKIGNFFNKLFKIKSKQICACGIYHFK